ncbi:MAG TPA: protein kinase [Longimicrobiales bacterium]
MKLSAGTQLGVYRIEKFLTSGGMGDVYLARHEQLERPVAIKVLSDAIASDPVAIQRFRREARAASTLNHPHICTLYDFCQQDGLAYLVLEFLEGMTLEARLRKRSLNLGEAVRIGAEIADALDHAHCRGFVHRDLKPANVMLTPEHGAKVLDFGLVARSPARLVDSAGGSAEPTPTADLTVDGHLVGTIPYMAPEQIQAGAVDARTDIYALGALLYEMITGKRAFEGRSALELAVAIVHSEPVPIRQREPRVPDLMVRLIERCMERDPEARWQSARDVAAELRWMSTSRGRELAAPEAERPGRRRTLRVGAAVTGLLAVGAGAVLVLPRLTESSASSAVPAAAFGIAAPSGVVFTESTRSIPALSPDGSRLLFVGTEPDGSTRIFVREIGRFDAEALPRTEDAVMPFWAPDGRSIGYFARGELMVLPAGGGPPVARADATLESRGASWSRDDVIIYTPGPRTGIHIVAAGSGSPRSLTTPDPSRGEIGHLWPSFLPDGRHFLFFVSSDADSTRGVYIASVDGTLRRRVTDAAGAATYGSGYLLFVRGGVLLAQPFDVRRLRLTGTPLVVREDVFTTSTYAGGFSVSEDGKLAYWDGATKDLTRFVWLDRTGQQLDTATGPARQRNPMLSRDGLFVVSERYADGDGDIVISDIGTGRTRRLANASTQERNPVWSPDGRSVVFVAEHSSGWAIYRWDMDTAQERVLLLQSDTDLMTTDWSPDGSTLLYAGRKASGDYDLYTLALDGAARPRPLLASEAHEISGRFSPSGRWFAYGSSESGVLEIYVQPYPPTGLRCQISNGGGYDPHWGATDTEIYYLSRSGMLMRSELRPSERCPSDPPRSLFRTPVRTPGSTRNHYAFSPGTGAFLFTSPAYDPATWTIHTMLDWPAALSQPER